MNPNAILKEARRVISVEGRAVLSLSKKLDKAFVKAVQRMAVCSGRIAIIGIGKSGLVGRKLASTFSSTGTPSLFLHPVECLHGDLGMLSADDIVLAISYSGETQEMSRLAPLLKNRGLYIIAITGKPKSRLARIADITITTPVSREACPYNITPTASTTAMLAAGDAIAIVLMKIKGFGRADFARFHPGGMLGKMLNMKVKDLMRTGIANPVIAENKSVKEALRVMTRTRTGAVSAVNSKGRLSGFFTDGDLRRQLLKNPGILTEPVSDVMTKNPVCAFPDTPACEAAEILSKKNIDNLPVINPDSGIPAGILDERDLLAEGLIERR